MFARSSLCTLVLLCSAFLLFASTIHSQEQDSLAVIGEIVPDHEFPRLYGHDGRTRLSQLRGHPVLVVGWKQFIPDGLHPAWIADELLDDYADDGLIVIFQNRNRWHENDWWGTQSFWRRSFGSPVWFGDGDPKKTPDLPIDRKTSKRDVHSFLLIGVDGTLILEDQILDAGAAQKRGGAKAGIVRAIKTELSRRKRGWGEDKTLRRARALLYGSNKIGPALAALDRSKATPEETDAVKAEVKQHFEAQLTSLRFLYEQGRLTEGAALHRSLASSLAKTPEMKAALDAIELPSRAELKRSRSLEKLLAIMETDAWRDIDTSALYDLRRFANKDAENAVGKRAARLDPLMKDLIRVRHGLKYPEIEAAIKRLEKKRGPLSPTR